MPQVFFDLLSGVPQAVANFGDWLITPINEEFLNISPIGLLGIGGTTFIVAIIGIHLVRLFV